MKEHIDSLFNSRDKIIFKACTLDAAAIQKGFGSSF